MKCIIVDDEELAIKVIQNHVQQVEGMEVIDTFSNAMDAFSALQKHQVDLMFLDIQMPKMSGLGLLRALPHPPPVILTTAHRDFALEGFELDIIDYLVKPIPLERFMKAITKVFRLQQSQTIVPTVDPTRELLAPPFIYVRENREFVKILLAEILYIESIKNHIRIFTAKKNFMPLLNMSQIEEKLPPQHFLRIHRSFIVGIDKIDRFSNTNLTIGEKLLPIGRFYKQEVMKRLRPNLL